MKLTKKDMRHIELRTLYDFTMNCLCHVKVLQLPFDIAFAQSKINIAPKEKDDELRMEIIFKRK